MKRRTVQVLVLAAAIMLVVGLPAALPVAASRIEQVALAGDGPLAAMEEEPAVVADELSPCTMTTTHIAAPGRVLLGEAFGVTLTVRGTCPPEEWFMHIVLVLDGSEAMAGRPRQEMKAGVTELIDAIEASKRSDEWTHERIRYGVVSFADNARQLCALNEDSARAKACVNRVGSTGGARLDLGIKQGLRTMRLGRRQADPDGTTEVMIVAAHGAGDTSCNSALLAARQARADGVLVVAKCETASCDEQCMRQLASSPRYYFRSWEPIGGIFQRIYDRNLNITFKKVVVTDTLSSAAAYEPLSAQPSPAATGPADRWLQWQDVYVPREGVTYTYRARALETGHHLVSDGAIGHAVDPRGRVVTFALTPPSVEVVEPPASPTVVPTRIPSLTPTLLPSATATLVPTSPTPVPASERPAYLPWTRR